ncbi:MAG: response regulator [Cyclobacteriaceae bacterium]
MGKTILVVDDFSSIRKFLCETLTKNGYETKAAIHGKEALEILQTESGAVDLVLSDFNMPQMNGMELLKSIKSDPKLAAKPVIFLTTDADPNKMREAKGLGLSAWITKPYKLPNFLAQIEYALK